MTNRRFADAWQTVLDQSRQAALLAGRHARQRSSLWLALAYTGMGGAWIAFSDRLLLDLSPDTAVFAAASEGKGFAFVLATGVLIHALASRTGRFVSASPVRAGKFRGTQLGWLFFVLAAAIVAAGLLAVVQSAQRARSQRVDQLRGLAAMRADALAGWISRRKSDAEALFSDPQLQLSYRQWRHGAGNSPPERFREELNTRLLATRFSSAWLLDAGGGILSSRSGDLPGVGTVQLRRELGAALHARAPLVANVQWEKRQDASMLQLDVLLPLFGLPGDPDSVLMIRAEPPLLSPPSAAHEIRLLVKRRTGAMGKGQGQAQERREETGQAVLGVTAPIEGSDWVVVAQMPRYAVDAAAWTELIWLGLADLFALLMAAALAYALRQRQELQSSRQERGELAEQVRGWQVLAAIADASTDAIYAKDKAGTYIFANRETCRLLGKSPLELLNCELRDVFAPDQADQLIAADKAAMISDKPTLAEAMLTTADGLRTYLCTKGPLFDSAGHLLGVFGVSRDVTERKRDEERNRQWALAFENIRDGVMITDTRCRIQAVNPAFSEITGYTAEEAIGASSRLLQSGRQPPEFYSQLWTELSSVGCWQGEIWNRRKNGEIYPQWLTISAIRDEAGHATHYVGVFTDETRLKRDEVKLERLAHYDALTDLPNRTLLLARLEDTLLRARRTARLTAVLVIDLDGFKTVNDSLGHPAGDELLVCIAGRLKARLRQEDTLGRLGGDEFLVTLEDLGNAADAAVLAQELLQLISAPVPLACGQDAYLTASIGISIHPDDGSVDAVELLRDADTAMYRAKELGRNRCCYYTSDMNAQAVSKLELEAALSRALGRHELLLHYQPKLDLRSGAIIGAEALLRWRRDDVGLVPPGLFIPVAEQSSLILEIGAWVIDEACRQLREWSDEGRPLVPVAVNVAARQFMAGDLDRIVSSALARHGIAAQWIEIELTEGMLVTDPQSAIDMMKRLQKLGIKLSLDDFGTGFSSLAYLQKFPIDALKIDQSFVRDIGKEPDGAALVDSVIALAHRFKLRVVAEGVETAAQQDYLLRQGCDEVQGYFIGRPASADAFQSMLKTAEMA